MKIPRSRRAVTRRRTIQAVGAGTVLSLAGCLGGGDDSDVPDPVDLSGGKLDYQGGMEIGRHGGPNGQVFYANNEPETPHTSGNSSEVRANLAWFHTLVHGLFPYHLERKQRGWGTEVVYVTDYSSVDWKLTEREGRNYMPAPTAPETFADATGLTYVAESDVRGGMGPTLVPFSDPEEADQFVADHGGQRVAFEDITQPLINDLQGS